MAAGSRMEITCAGRTVSVSNPDRVVFPDRHVTKGALVEYYCAVADRLFAAIGHRPTTLERWPQGVHPGYRLGAEGFYAKRVLRGAPSWVGSCEITFPSGRTAVQLCPAEPATAVWAAHMGTVTFHPWPVSSPRVDHPDQLRIDFDPQPGTDYQDAVSAAFVARQVLNELGMTGFVKTSGGRGVHLFVPLEPRWDFIAVRQAVIALGREVQRRRPDLVTLEWWREERGPRVFVDYNQAARDRTMAAAYSVRALPGAPVSTPVTWLELPEVDPMQFTIATVPHRLEQPDPWADFNAERFELTELLQWWQRDLSDGLGELPYPPDYPKMPGEPTRVQPSRARKDR